MKLNNGYEKNRQSNMRHSAKQYHNFFADVTGQVFETTAATHSVKDRHMTERRRETHANVYMHMQEKRGGRNKLTGR